MNRSQFKSLAIKILNYDLLTMIKILVLTLLFPLVASAFDYEEGDLVFQECQGQICPALKTLTHSRWTHVGMIVKENNQVMVAEAGSTIRLSPIQNFIASGVKNDFVVKRLDKKVGTLDASSITELKMSLKPFLGASYDYWFEWSDQVIYCSELVWKVFANALKIELSKPQKLKDFDLENPLAKAWIYQMYTKQGKKLNPEEPVVSPAALYESPLLVEVYRAVHP